ncbi:hypothetical protein HY497_00585, partial [Candidatus Woesearchaeota archaeon]|nr:hypothetical protein [Candidatus Woesearchaeota archaeon]
GLDQEKCTEFVALRLLLPAAIQINEEAQYVENEMLTAHMAVVMKTVGKKLGKSMEELEAMTYNELVGAVKGEMKKIAQGIGVSRGTAQGKVKIIRDMNDHARFEEGDILVTKITDPTMVLVMGKAAGIICDIGSMVSHPSILSREMGIPCIVSAKCVTTGKPVTEILREGQVVTMDGTSGEVYNVR